MATVYSVDNDDRFPNIQVAIRTLLTGGFILDSTHREPGYMLIHAYRFDEFGAKQKYCFALADGNLGEAQIEGMQIAVEHTSAQLVVVGETTAEIPHIEWLRFINLFGGPIFSSMPIEKLFASHLETLAFNKLPDGLKGTPDDLFEEYVRTALEFIVAGRVLRYGQERLFEARPDGLIIPRPDFTALYDTKAYSEGYVVTVDTIRQFSSYVRDFQRRYIPYRQRLNTFIVVSGSFRHREDTLEKRSRELLSECGVPLSFLTATDLSSIIQSLKKHPFVRRSINWARIFSEPVVKPEQVQTEMESLINDGLLPNGEE